MDKALLKKRIKSFVKGIPFTMDKLRGKAYVVDSFILLVVDEGEYKGEYLLDYIDLILMNKTINRIMG